MPRVKPDEIVYALRREFRNALSDTMTRFAPGVEYSEDVLFAFFAEAIYRHCGDWKHVPDDCVEA